MLDKELVEMNNEECDNIGDNVAPNSEHVNEQEAFCKSEAKLIIWLL